MLTEAKKLFDGEQSRSVDYFSRHDFIGGHIGLRLTRKDGKIVLSVFDEEEGSEIEIKTVETYAEVLDFANAIR